MMYGYIGDGKGKDNLLKKTLYFRRPFLILAIIFSLLLSAACGFGVEKTGGNKGEIVVTDCKGRTVKIAHKPQRIVSFSIYTDQILLGLVHSRRMAAVNYFLEDPKESVVVEKAKKIKNKVINPSAEQVVSWKPDLIIANEWTEPEAISVYSDMGIPVIICNKATNYNEIQESIRLISEAVGETENGRKMIEIMDAKMREIKKKVDRIPEERRKKVVIISVMTDFGGKGSIFDNMCHYAGVKNGLVEIGLKNGQKLTKELLVKSNPDVLFLPDYDDGGRFDTEKFIKSYLDDPALQPVKAIKSKSVCIPRDYYIYNCSQDVVYGIQELAYKVYGDEFKLEGGKTICVSGE